MMIPWQQLFQILEFIVVLSFLVVIHELGHFFVAKFFGVRVEEFGVGYPPLARRLFTWAGTVFTLNWIPFGGFVRLAGEEDQVEQGADHAPRRDGSVSLDKGLFYAQPLLPKLSIIVAGAAVNFLFGVAAFSIYFSVLGIPTAVPRIATIAPNSPAAAAQIPASVTVLGFVEGSERVMLKTVPQVSRYIKEHAGQQLTVLTTGHCDADGCAGEEQQFKVYVRRPDEIPEGQGAMGIEFASLIEPTFYPWYEMPLRGASYGVQQALYVAQYIIVSLGDVLRRSIRGVFPQELTGLVGIYDQADKAGIFTGGAWEILNFAGLLSVNLAIMNLLPIPVLDGGRAVFLCLEKVIGKRRVHFLENYANYVAIAFLVFLMIFVTVKDIRQLIVR